MKRLLHIQYIIFSVCMLACNNNDVLNTSITANTKDEYANSRIATKPVPEWAEMLRHDTGWIGADGIYCTALSGIDKPGQMNDQSETMFWFSDCILGNIDTKSDTLKGDWQMMNNSVAYFHGANPDPNKINYYWRRDSGGKPLSMFEPHTPKAPEKSYYWLGDGFMNHAKDSTIYIFAYLIHNVPGGIYPFEDLGVSMIALPKGSRPPYADQKQFDTPLFFTDARGKTVFGICVLPNTVGAGAPKPDGLFTCMECVA